jgi:hypothetical protein
MPMLEFAYYVAVSTAMTAVFIGWAKWLAR